MFSNVFINSASRLQLRIAIRAVVSLVNQTIRRIKIIGLTGAHRTGKTTLAKAYAEKHNIAYCETTGSQVFKDLGFSPQEDLDFETRLTIQEAILKSFEKQYASIGRLFIADRTPIDLMAYMLADVSRAPLGEKLETRLGKYLNDCIALNNEVFKILVVVQPGIILVADEAKAPISHGYIEHIARLTAGLAVQENIKSRHFYIPQQMTNLNMRIDCVAYAFRKSMAKHEQDFFNNADEAIVSLH